MEAIDLFCGAGGLSCGLQKAGIKILAGYDVDADCKYAFEENIGAEFVEKDVFSVTAEELLNRFSGTESTLLAGCAPCQKYSSLRHRDSSSRYGRWRLVKKFAQLTLETRPNFVTMENVPNVRQSAEFLNFVDDLSTEGYGVWFDVVDCSRFGVPQKRKRLVLIARRDGSVGCLNPDTRSQTVDEAIGTLPPLEAGSVDRDDSLHRVAGLSDLNLLRIRSSLPGGSWRDWPEELRLACHKTDTGGRYTPVYGRMRADAPAPTITTRCYNYGSGRFGHPSQDRCISLREAALIQSFPADYKFEKVDMEPSLGQTAKLIGNAVPPALAKYIGTHILRSEMDV